MKYLLLFFTLLIAAFCNGQKQDYVWILGYNPGTIGPNHSVMDFDFNLAPPLISRRNKSSMDFSFVNASICDEDGNLMLYSNGKYIANSNDELIENGNGMNPGEVNPRVQGIQFLPGITDSINYYFNLSSVYDNQYGTLVNELYYSEINHTDLFPSGIVVQKNKLLLKDTLAKGKLISITHANGRDWWIIIPKFISNGYFTFLLSQSGVEGPFFQQIGKVMTERDNSGQAVFSPDGSKYIRYDIDNDLNIFDFDRCSGILSNPIHIPIHDLADTLNGGGGVAVSPNSRFVYVSSTMLAYRFDLWASDIAASKKVIAVYDGYQSPFGSTFYLAQLAPDGNIYLSCTNGENVLHIITNPDFEGLSRFRQHAVQLPTYNAFGLPNLPHYRLGPVDGSPCDTLGIDNIPLARFRQDIVDSSDLHTRFFTDLSAYEPTSWHWDFGDGQSSTTRYPLHTYSNSGSYEVCLTVANENGEDETCQVIAILVTATEEAASLSERAIRLFPNPVDEVLHVRRADIAADLVLELVDVSGRVLLYKRIAAGVSEATIDVHELEAGLYFCRRYADGVLMGVEKVVVL